MAQKMLVWTFCLSALCFLHAQGIRVSSCTKPPNKDIITVNWVNTAPSPLVYPGRIALTASVTVNEPIQGNLRAELTISRMVGKMRVDLPCINTPRGRLGSCVYENICSLTRQRNGTCPRLMANNKIPCSCPIAPGTYTIPQTVLPINLKKFNIPASVITGEYQAILRLTDVTTMTQLLCLDADIKIEDPPFKRNRFGNIGRFLVNLFG